MLAAYRQPVLWKSLVQLGSTVLPLGVLWFAMLWSLEVGYWLTLLLAVPTSLLVVRLFMLQHDCGHGAFFRRGAADNLTGSVLAGLHPGAVCLLAPHPLAAPRRLGKPRVPGLRRHRHADRPRVPEPAVVEARALPDVSASVVLLLIGPTWQFILKHRPPARHAARLEAGSRGRTALESRAGFGGGGHVDDRRHRPVPDGAAAHHAAGRLDRRLALLRAAPVRGHVLALPRRVELLRRGARGRVAPQMPKLLQWATANIGLHHIHHVSSRIPNYHLQRCYDSHPELREVTTLTLPASVKTLRLTLWDEDGRRLVGFRELGASGGGSTRAHRRSPAPPRGVPRSWR